MKLQNALVALVFATTYGAAAHAEDAYRRAVMNYQAHHYSAALADLEKLVSQYPNNAMVRYYRALAYQGTNQLSLARKDFEWVATNCPEGKVRQLGAAGLQNLGGYHSGSSSTANSLANNGVQKFFAQAAPAGGSGQTGGPGAASGSQSSGVSSPQVSARPGGNLKKVLEFTKDNCVPCINFAPIFAQTKSRYPNLDMQSLDVADANNASLVAQYGVVNYPTIVFLSDNGTVLFKRAAAPDSVKQFSNLIDMYR